MLNITKEIELRGMNPSERHPKIMAMWNSLEKGEGMKISNDHDPKPLKYMFAAEFPGMFEWNFLEEGPVDWIFTIARV